MTSLKRFFDHDPIDSLLEPWDVLFRDLFNKDSVFSPIFYSKPSYPTDVYEDDKSVTIEIAVAGLNKDDIEIEEDDGLITVSYQKKEETKRDDLNYIQRGIAKRAFKLSWKFSDKFDFNNIEATMDKGILKIVIPKKDEDKMISDKNIIKIKSIDEINRAKMIDDVKEIKEEKRSKKEKT